MIYYPVPATGRKCLMPLAKQLRSPIDRLAHRTGLFHCPSTELDEEQQNFIVSKVLEFVANR